MKKLLLCFSLLVPGSSFGMGVDAMLGVFIIGGTKLLYDAIAHTVHLNNALKRGDNERIKELIYAFDVASVKKELLLDWALLNNHNGEYDNAIKRVVEKGFDVEKVNEKNRLLDWGIEKDHAHLINQLQKNGKCHPFMAYKGARLIEVSKRNVKNKFAERRLLDYKYKRIVGQQNSECCVCFNELNGRSFTVCDNQCLSPICIDCKKILRCCPICRSPLEKDTYVLEPGFIERFTATLTLTS